MTTSELQDLIVSTLLREHGGLRRRWRIVVGSLRLHDLATHAHCNWSLAPSGDYRENDRVERLLDRMRLDHPIVTPG